MFAPAKLRQPTAGDDRELARLYPLPETPSLCLNLLSTKAITSASIIAVVALTVATYLNSRGRCRQRPRGGSRESPWAGQRTTSRQDRAEARRSPRRGAGEQPAVLKRSTGVDENVPGRSEPSAHARKKDLNPTKQSNRSTMASHRSHLRVRSSSTRTSFSRDRPRVAVGT